VLLTISTTSNPATDLGYLLHKNPSRAQEFNLAFGRAHVFYPEATPERCVAAMLVDVDSVELLRDGQAISPPSSLLSVAIAQVFGSALGGRCKERQELAERAIPLECRVSAASCRGEFDLPGRFFAPLGYEVNVTRWPLDEVLYPGEASRVMAIDLRATTRLGAMLSHLYVLLPVLDNDKHYFVGDDEVEKLLKRGEGWLATHPEKELITARYLKHRRPLVNAALERLRDDAPTEAEPESPDDPREEKVERELSLHEQRHATVIATLRALGAASVVDLGCGEGRLLRELLRDARFTRVVGVDVSSRSLEIAADRLRLDTLPPKVRERIELRQGALTYRDGRLEGFDAAAVVEVIEHLDEPRLAAFERVVFECARPRAVIVTTPNREYNVKWETLPAGIMRHRDHRFEWTRAEFAAWCTRVAERFGYRVQVTPVGPEDEAVGAPSQMGVFEAVRR